MFFPDKRIASRLRDERGGVWIANSTNAPKLWLVTKLPNHTIRDVHSGADVTLNVYVVDVSGVRVAVFGFTIFDDLDHPKMVTGACRSQLEIENLTSLLKLDCLPIQFHNENGMPMLSAQCSFYPANAKRVVESLPDDHPVDGYAVRQEALDIVQEWSDNPSQTEPRILTRCKLPIQLTNYEVFNVHLPTVGTVNLDDADQGKELELLTLQLFDEAFSYGAYHSPQREDSKGLLEVCDVLAVSRIRQVEREGIFVVQNKVAATDGNIRTLDRRGATIRKNIRKAIKQSVGAIKKLKSGSQIFKKDGTKIEEDRPEIAGVVEPLDLVARAHEVGYGVILISDMHEGVDWVDVLFELADATQETGYYHYVLDLQEMYALITNCNGQPAILESYLIQRWEKMASERTAMIRSQFIHCESNKDE
jgi:hypothetical protein